MHSLVNYNVPADKLAVHWFGQSSFAIKTPADTIILVDPYFPHDRPANVFIHAEPPLDESTLPVHGVLLTHDHGDHTHPETLKRVFKNSPEAIFLGPIESKLRVVELCIDNDKFITAKSGNSYSIRDLSIHVVYAKPPEGDPANNIDPPDVTHIGFVIECDDVRLYITGDPINTFADIEALVEPVKALAPQIGWITCHPTEGEFPFFEGCVNMAQRVGLEQVFPAHYQCFIERNYDPNEWASRFPGEGPKSRVLKYNDKVVVP